MAAVLAGLGPARLDSGRNHGASLLIAILLCSFRSAAWAAEEPFDWPGLSERGLILDALRAADPYNHTSHHSLHGSLDHNHHKRIGFHWVITSCDVRTMWARTLASTLLSALASGVHPTTITIVWCKPYSEEAEASIFGNMRLSSLIKVLYMPASLESSKDMERSLRIRVTYLMALNVPQYYDAPDLPLLQTEDDCIFAPDFNTKLAEVAAEIESRNKGPYFVSLYSGHGPIPLAEERAKHNAKRRDQFDANQRVAVRHGGWSWGTQGFLFSASLVPGLRSFFQEVLHGQHEQVGLQDMILLDFVKVFQNQQVAGHAAVKIYSTDPSLVEHIGAQSSIFGDQNTRFHMAGSFPFKVLLPADDPVGTW